MRESVRGLAKKTPRCQINAGACGLGGEFGYKYQHLDGSIFPEIAIFAHNVTGVMTNPTELLLIWGCICTTLIVDAFSPNMPTVSAASYIHCQSRHASREAFRVTTLKGEP